MTAHNEQKRRGMPAGRLLYEKQLFLNQLTDEFKTTFQIVNEINALGAFKRVSWNTIQKYLGLLASEGKVEMRKVGKYNLWRRADGRIEKPIEVVH